jgi:hypothetical protein
MARDGEDSVSQARQKTNKKAKPKLTTGFFMALLQGTVLTSTIRSVSQLSMTNTKS